MPGPSKGDKSMLDSSEESSGGSSEEEFEGFTDNMDKNKAESPGVSRADVAQANAMAKQLHVYKSGIDFVPGARLEVLDARDNNWYQCKVVEVDWGELDILVHYERWSNRFDEWLKMDSTRIRPLVRSSTRKERDKRITGPFRIGEKVYARWPVDNKRYQAKITKSMGDDQFEVLFYDGVSKVVRAGNMTRMESKSPRTSIDASGSVDDPSGSSPRKLGQDFDDDMLLSPAGTTASSNDSHPSSPEPYLDDKTPARKSIFDVEIIEKKRQPKRKAAVEELFQSFKKRRKIELSPPAKSFHSGRFGSSKDSRSKRKSREPVVVPSTSGIQEVVDRGSSESPMPPSSPKSIIMELKDGWKKCCIQRTSGNSAGKWDVYYLTPEKKKLRSRHDLARYLEYRNIDMDPNDFDFSAKSLKEAQKQKRKGKDPKQEPAEKIKRQDSEGKDKQKLIQPSDEIKDASKTESSQVTLKSIGDRKSKFSEFEEDIINVRKIKEEADNPDIITEELSGKKRDTKMVIEIPIMPKKEPAGSSSSIGAHDLSPSWPYSLQKSINQAKESTSDDQIAGSGSPVPLTSSSMTSLSSKLSSTPTRLKHVLKKEPILAPNEFVVKPLHNEHKCPKSGCLKSFRKENLLQMHIKHYHPDILKKSSSSAPNVADLAYARTVGDHLDMNIPQTQPLPPMEKIIKTETSSSKKSSRAVLTSSSLSEVRGKSSDKKSYSLGGSVSSSTPQKSKESKKKELLKIEPVKAKPSSDDETSIKEELDDYVDDLEEESEVPVIGFQEVDPDYVPCDADGTSKKDKKYRLRNRSDSKGKKRKSDVGVPEPSTSTTASKKISIQGIEESPNLEVEEDTTDTWGDGAENQEIINCGCGSTEEEGLMLQCDVCLCWQHGACYNIKGEDQVPDKYICSLCDHPRLERSSHKFRHHQDWLKEGRLPRFSFSKNRGDVRLESCVRRGHELTANVVQLSQVLHSLRLKLHIAKSADHPKFVMWHKKWNEKRETDDPMNEGPTTSAGNADAMQDLMDIVDIVSNEGSNIQNAGAGMDSSMMQVPQLMTSANATAAGPVMSYTSQTNAGMNMNGNQVPLMHQTSVNSHIGFNSSGINQSLGLSNSKMEIDQKVSYNLGSVPVVPSVGHKLSGDTEGIKEEDLKPTQIKTEDSSGPSQVSNVPTNESKVSINDKIPVTDSIKEEGKKSLGIELEGDKKSPYIELKNDEKSPDIELKGDKRSPDIELMGDKKSPDIELKGDKKSPDIESKSGDSLEIDVAPKEQPPTDNNESKFDSSEMLNKDHNQEKQGEDSADKLEGQTVVNSPKEDPIDASIDNEEWESEVKPVESKEKVVDVEMTDEKTPSKQMDSEEIVPIVKDEDAMEVEDTSNVKPESSLEGSETKAESSGIKLESTETKQGSTETKSDRTKTKLESAETNDEIKPEETCVEAMETDSKEVDSSITNIEKLEGMETGDEEGTKSIMKESEPLEGKEIDKAPAISEEKGETAIMDISGRESEDTTSIISEEKGGKTSPFSEEKEGDTYPTGEKESNVSVTSGEKESDTSPPGDKENTVSITSGEKEGEASPPGEKERNVSINSGEKEGKTSPPVEKESKTSPPVEKEGKTSPPVEKEGKTSPPVEKEGKTSSPVEKEGKASPTVEKEGKTSPPVDKGGKTSPPVEKEGKTSPSVEKEGKTSPISEERESNLNPISEEEKGKASSISEEKEGKTSSISEEKEEKISSISAEKEEKTSSLSGEKEENRTSMENVTASRKQPKEEDSYLPNIKSTVDIPNASGNMNQSDVGKESSEPKVEEHNDLDQLDMNVDDIELPHPGDIVSSGLTHPGSLDQTDNVLDDNTNLDDGDDLALDLGGLENTGVGGMPENSDLADLLSSHSELEQFVSQASSELSSHIPVSVGPPVPAPIIPEAERIEPVNCKLNLLEHVQVVQGNINQRFDQIEKQLEVLEAEMGLTSDIGDDDEEEESEERDPTTLQARSLIKLIMSDVNVVKKISQYSG